MACNTYLTVALAVFAIAIGSHFVSSENKDLKANVSQTTKDHVYNTQQETTLSLPEVTAGSTKPQCLLDKPTDISKSTSFRAKQVTSSIGDDSECHADIQTISVSARLAQSCIDDFKSDYTTLRLGIPWDVAVSFYPDTENDKLDICDQEEECFQVLPQVPPIPHHPPSSEDELKRILVQTLSFAQSYSVAFESLFFYEFLHDVDFTEKMVECPSHITEVVGTLLASVKNCTLEPDQELIQNLISKSYRGVESGDLRGQRGFRTLRQCLLGLQYITDMFPEEEDCVSN